MSGTLLVDTAPRRATSAPHAGLRVANSIATAAIASASDSDSDFNSPLTMNLPVDGLALVDTYQSWGCREEWATLAPEQARRTLRTDHLVVAVRGGYDTIPKPGVLPCR